MGEPETYWDAGQMGCGELLIELRFKMANLKAGQQIKVIAEDPGAREDMPAWCKLTGHKLLSFEHPQYVIEKK
jgi:tRNA 2-thiouridine synthesizing protein A